MEDDRLNEQKKDRILIEMRHNKQIRRLIPLLKDYENRLVALERATAKKPRGRPRLNKEPSEKKK